MNNGTEGELHPRHERSVFTPQDRTRSGHDLYQRYLAELADYPLLDADAELALACTIAARELDVWVALLSDAGRLDQLAAVWGASLGAMPEGWAAFCAQSQRGEVTDEGRQEMARILRDADEGRVVRRALERVVLEHTASAQCTDPFVARLVRTRRRYQLATSRMVTANLRLVVALARRYGVPRLLSASDFVQEGNLGLLRAVELFDPRRGVRFSTYAAWWIRHAFNRALSDRGRLVRVPESVLQEMHRVVRARNGWLARRGEEPGADELAAATGVPVERVESLLAQGTIYTPLSLDAEVGEHGRPMMDRLAAETPDIAGQVDAASFAQTVRPLFARLTDMEAAVLRMRFGLEGDEPQTLREVGEKVGLTRERIRQLQEKALAKLRDALPGAADFPTVGELRGDARSVAELPS